MKEEGRRKKYDFILHPFALILFQNTPCILLTYPVSSTYPLPVTARPTLVPVKRTAPSQYGKLTRISCSAIHGSTTRSICADGTTTRHREGYTPLLSGLCHVASG